MFIIFNKNEITQEQKKEENLWDSRYVNRVLREMILQSNRVQCKYKHVFAFNPPFVGGQRRRCFVIEIFQEYNLSNNTKIAWYSWVNVPHTMVNYIATEA